MTWAALSILLAVGANGALPATDRHHMGPPDDYISRYERPLQDGGSYLRCLLERQHGPTDPCDF